MIEIQGAKVPIKAWVTDEYVLEPDAVKQLKNVANLPWVEGVAAMPDAHFGLGATVGSVIKSRHAVSPSVVGVDIGCGMMAVKTTLQASDVSKLSVMRHSIERSVPVGFDEHKEIRDSARQRFCGMEQLSEIGLPFEKKALHQMGTLGGGNHFIELCSDQEGTLWVMLHSGSRGIGNQLARIHLEKAKGLMGEMVKRFGQEVDKDLAALAIGTPEYDAYMKDLHWCQDYARHNRESILELVLKDLSYHMWGEYRNPTQWVALNVACHHNYIETGEDEVSSYLITRKGAVSAKAGEFGIIPGSMGQKSFIVVGKGNQESYCSCSHGAGRRMSRTKAKKQFTVDDMIAQTAGVECRKDAGVIDEIPGAYKDIDQVMRDQADLVDVFAELKQFICVKG